MGMHAPEVNIRKIIESKFFLLLVILISFIILLPFSIDSVVGRWSINIIGYLVFITVVYLVRKRRKQFIFFVILAILAFLSDVAHMYFNTLLTDIFDAISSSLFYISITVIIMSHILRGKQITLDTIFGAICVYLFIGITYTFIFQLIEHLLPGAFHISGPLAQIVTAEHSTYYLMYFSFTTLSTVGFGDITPLSTYAIPFVILEEVTGVLYLAILVARLVAGFTLRDNH